MESKVVKVMETVDSHPFLDSDQHREMLIRLGIIRFVTNMFWRYNLYNRVTIVEITMNYP